MVADKSNAGQILRFPVIFQKADMEHIVYVPLWKELETVRLCTNLCNYFERNKLFGIMFERQFLCPNIPPVQMYQIPLLEFGCRFIVFIILLPFPSLGSRRVATLVLLR